VRLVVAEGKLTEEQQARLRSIVRETTGYPFSKARSTSSF